MAHKGEDIKFTLKGDKNINLIGMNFKVLVYQPEDCCNPDKVVKVETFEQVKDKNGVGLNEYICKIPYSISKTMKEGKYNMELVLISEDEGTQERSIFVKKNAFNLECAAAKDIE